MKIIYNFIRLAIVLVGLVPWWPRRKRQARASMSSTLSDISWMRATIEAMFEYLDRLETALDATGKVATADERRSLGLPGYRFIEGRHQAGTFTCGAPVKFVFLGKDESAERSEVVARTRAGIPKAAVNDPEMCARRWLCYPHLVRQEFRLCGQDLVVVRNGAPYSRNHGLVRSAAHEPQSSCFEPFRLAVALSVARALGSETGQSRYEVWVAGQGFNTQWHFHVQFRRQRGPIWTYIDGWKRPPSTSDLREAYPSKPTYLEDDDPARLIESLYREIWPYLPTPRPEDAGHGAGAAERGVEERHAAGIQLDGHPESRPALGLLLSYEAARWRAILVRSWYRPGEQLLGKQPGLHEHLGEVILESEEAFLRVQADPEAATEGLETLLKTWSQPTKADARD